MCRTIVERITQPLYDIQHVSEGTTRKWFFTSPMGEQGKTFEDTNLILPGYLHKTQSFLIESVRVRPLFRKPEFYGCGQLELVIGSRIYLVGAPLREFKAYRGFLVEPLQLQPLQNFGVALIWHSGFRWDGRVSVHLYGTLSRSVA